MGIAKNNILNRHIEADLVQAEHEVATFVHEVRQFTEIHYKAASWDHDRKVISKIKVTEKGRNPRYVLVNPGDPKRSYDKLYCVQDEMKN